MTIQQIIDHLESIAPLPLQESYDNSGLLVGDASTRIKKALITLDSTEDVVDEAISKNCQLIISHHPIIFSGLKNLTGKDYIQRTIIKAIKNDIAIYAIHTNLDNVACGVNLMICKKLGVKNPRILAPKTNSGPFQDGMVGSGMIGNLETPLTAKEFLHRIQKSLKSRCIRHTKLLPGKVKTVAVCGGSGSFLLPDAIRESADFFVTADFKYHQFFDAELKIVIADAGHYETEQYTKQLLQKILQEKFPNFALILSKINTNPIKYHI